MNSGSPWSGSPATAEPSGGLIRVLLVEDNPTDRLLLMQSLRDAGVEGFAVIAVDRLAAAIERVQSEPFDAMLLDLALPDSQGLSTFISARDLCPDLPIIVLSGLDDDALALTSVKEGAQDWLVKGRADGPLVARAVRYAMERKQGEKLRAKHEQLTEMSQQLLQAAKLATMGELAASIAHELNNPLAIVSLRVESLLAEVPPEDPKRRPLEVIAEEVERMGKLVSRLLDHSHPDRQVSTVDVPGEIEATLELVQYHLRNRNITVVRELGPVPPVHADRQQLRQLFLNLFTNASDAMPQGGTLTIRVDELAADSSQHSGVRGQGSGVSSLESAVRGQGSGQHSPVLSTQHSTLRTPQPSPNAPRERGSVRVVGSADFGLRSIGESAERTALIVEVADTGVGIPLEDLPRVFEPFFTTKPAGKGTGLGLSICRRIAEEHGGSFEITSEVGTGTTVRVTLPATRGERG